MAFKLLIAAGVRSDQLLQTRTDQFDLEQSLRAILVDLMKGRGARSTNFVSLFLTQSAAPIRVNRHARITFCTKTDFVKQRAIPTSSLHVCEQALKEAPEARYEIKCVARLSAP